MIHLFSFCSPTWFLNLQGSQIHTFLYKCRIRQILRLEKEYEDSHLKDSETRALRKTLMRLTKHFKKSSAGMTAPSLVKH